VLAWIPRPVGARQISREDVRRRRRLGQGAERRHQALQVIQSLGACPAFLRKAEVDYCQQTACRRCAAAGDVNPALIGGSLCGKTAETPCRLGGEEHEACFLPCLLLTPPPRQFARGQGR